MRAAILILLLVASPHLAWGGGRGERVTVGDEIGDRIILSPLSFSELNAMAMRDPATVYAAGRAAMARGMHASALRAFEWSATRQEDPWRSLSAAAAAEIHLGRGELDRARERGLQATAGLPLWIDGWMAAGAALYAAERWDELRVLASNVISFEVDAGHVGERTDLAALQAEAYLWRAVALHAVDADWQGAFRDAFVFVPAGPVHRRLYLYLFYRTGELARLAPDDATLLDAVYRAAVDEWEESARLLLTLTPERFALELERSAGFQDTVDRVVAAVPADGERLIDRAVPVPGIAEALRARVLLRRDAVDAALEILSPQAVTTDLGRRARDEIARRVFELRRSPREAVAALAALDATEAELARAVDRLLPPLVRSGDWAAIARLRTALPERAGEARAHVALVLAAGTGEEALLSGAAARPSTEWIGLAARALGGRPADDAAVGAPSEPSPQRDLRLAVADALLIAGRPSDAYRLAMDAARDPAHASEALALAQRLQDAGAVPESLDVARRAATRALVEPDDAVRRLLYPRAYDGDIVDAAGRYGIPEALLFALVREESHFNPGARSSVGAQGLVQIMPATAEDIARQLGRATWNIGSPDDNLAFATFYLDGLLTRFDDLVLALAAYNAGRGRVGEWEREFGDLDPLLRIEAIPFVETRWYLRRILVSSAWYADPSDPAAALTQRLRSDRWR